MNIQHFFDPRTWTLTYKGDSRARMRWVSDEGRVCSPRRGTVCLNRFARFSAR